MAGEERARKREVKMHAAYAALEALYGSNEPRDEKLAEKSRILRQLEKDLGAKRTLTNASLVQFKTYHSGEEELAQLLSACGGDVTRLVALLTAWQHGRFGTDQEDPATMLRPLVAKGCTL